MGMRYYKDSSENGTVVNVLDNAMVTATDTEIQLWFWDEDFDDYFIEGQWGTVEGGFQTENPQDAITGILEYIESWDFSDEDVEDTRLNLRKHFGL